MNLSNKSRASIFGLVLLIVSSAASAGPIFSVNRSIGTGSVSGSIQTDGTLGVLSGANILDWNLTIDDGQGSGSFNLLGPLSGPNSGLGLVGTAFSATMNQLLFDFSAVGQAYVLFQNPTTGSGQNWWCLTANISCDGAAPLDAESVNRIGASVFVAQTGRVVVGTPSSDAIPEPTTLMLFALGLAGFGLSRRKKA